MIYKGIFLSVLFVSFSIASDTIDIRIKKLKADRSKKMSELSRIGKEIEEQEKLLECMMKNAIATITKIFEAFNEQEKKEFFADLNIFEERYKAMIVAGVTNFLIDELFVDKATNHYEIERIRSLIMRRLIEKEILKELLQNYEEHLNEKTKIELELSELEQSGS